MKQVIRYEARDGRLFSCEESCVSHERDLDNIDAANLILREGGSVSQALFVARGCDVPILPAWDAVLQTVTRETGISIPHWQCRDEAGYRVVRIESRDRVYVHGDAGSWSGPYGSSVQVGDLVRYVTSSRERSASQ